MKKSMLILLCLCLLLSLCACGGSQTAPAAESKPAKAQSEQDRPTEAPAAEAQSEAAQPAEAEPETTEPAEAEPETDGDALPLGKLSTEENGTRYENAWLGFSLELDQSWYVYNEEETAQLIGVTYDMFDGSQYEEMLRSAPVFYDFFAGRSDMSSINLNFTDLKGVKIPDLDMYLETMKPYLEQVLSSSDMRNVTVEKNSVTFAGKELTGLKLEADADVGHYYCQQIHFVVNGRLGALSVGCFGQDITPELLELFKPLP